MSRVFACGVLAVLAAWLPPAVSAQTITGSAEVNVTNAVTDSATQVTSDTTIGNIVLTVAGVATPIPIPVAARTGPRVRRGPSRTRMTSPATAPAARIEVRYPHAGTAPPHRTAASGSRAVRRSASTTTSSFHCR